MAERSPRGFRLIKTREWPAGTRGARRRLPQEAIAFAASFAALLVLHAPLLQLPYFWDEAGYYIPAAHDLFTSGALVPYSTAANPHPPLVLAVLALAWRVFNFSPLTTRVTILLWAALALAGLYRLAQRVANRQVAIAAMVLTGLYPVFFSQSVLAHLDMAAAALTLWALDSYVERRTAACIALFTLAALAKETALIAPAALFAWELLCLDLRRWPRFHAACPPKPRRLWEPLWLLVPALPVAAWFGYVYAGTGHWLGDPGFVRYNLTATLSPVRFVLALGHRLWQLTAHMNLYVLSAATLLAMFFPALLEPTGAGVIVMPERPPERRRIAIATQAAFAVVTLGYIFALSLLGGALLTRYLLPVAPLFILICVSTLRRRVAMWPYAVAIVALGFVLALFINPPYRFAPEDNLAWRDYVLLHQQAIEVVQARSRGARVLTAWPASDELTRPELGYVRRPVPVERIENFSAQEIAQAANAARLPRGSDSVAKSSPSTTQPWTAALLFSTKYEPPQGSPLDGVPGWRQLQRDYFDYHTDLPPQVAAEQLGTHIVFMQSRGGQWVAVAER